MNIQELIKKLEVRVKEMNNASKTIEDLTNALEIKQEDNPLKLKKENNFFKGSLSTPICRFFKWKYLKQILTEQKVGLVHYKKWQDPFEGFFFGKRNTLKYDDAQVDASTLTHIYGQCWTLNTKEMSKDWLVYSPDRDGIFIKTTIEKLWNFMFDSMNQKQYGYIGEVQYQTENELRNQRKQLRIEHIIQRNVMCNPEALLKLFLLKRIGFSDEKEIRILFYDQYEIAKYITDYVPCFKVEINNFFDTFKNECDEYHFLADPRMDDAFFGNIKSFVKEKNFKIKKSTLYTPLED